MVNSELEISLANVVRGMLPYANVRNSYYSKEKKAVYVKIQLECEHMDNCERKFLHFIFTGNVCVWCAVNREYFLDRIPYDEFRNTSNHDSCWTSDGVGDIFHTYIELCEYVQKDVPEEKQVAPVNIKTFNFIKDVKFVNIKYEKYDDYKFKLTKIKEDE